VIHNRIRNSPPTSSKPSHIDSVQCLHTTSWGPILVLFSHIRLGIPRFLFPSGLLTKPVHISPPRFLHFLHISFLLFSKFDLWLTHMTLSVLLIYDQYGVTILSASNFAMFCCYHMRSTVEHLTFIVRYDFTLRYRIAFIHLKIFPKISLITLHEWVAKISTMPPFMCTWRSVHC
jgi:hypothetical protein